MNGVKMLDEARDDARRAQILPPIEQLKELLGAADFNRPNAP